MLPFIEGAHSQQHAKIIQEMVMFARAEDPSGRLRSFVCELPKLSQRLWN